MWRKDGLCTNLIYKGSSPGITSSSPTKGIECVLRLACNAHLLTSHHHLLTSLPSPPHIIPSPPHITPITYSHHTHHNLTSLPSPPHITPITSSHHPNTSSHYTITSSPLYVQEGDTFHLRKLQQFTTTINLMESRTLQKTTWKDGHPYI